MLAKMFLKKHGNRADTEIRLLKTEILFDTFLKSRN